jgi:RNA polymerase sigma factor (sigma-70 family)
MPPPTEVFASRLFLGPALRAQPDGRLVMLVREGYEAAFEEIVRRYGRPLARYAASIVGSRSEDVTQDAFSKALAAMRRDEKEIELRPWLYRIVRNTALNDLRDRPPTPEILEEAIAAGRGTVADAEQREELRELIDRLQALPERQRAAIVMRELEGLSHEEIAASLGLSGGAARQVIFRAREALRSGAGLLLPVPLVRMLMDYGPEATAGAGAGAGLVAAGGAAGGAGTALKAGAVAAILAGSVGTGIALQENHGNSGRADAATFSSDRGGRTAPQAAAPASAGHASGSGAESGDDNGETGDRGTGRGDDPGRTGNGPSARRGEEDRSGRGGRSEAVGTGHGGPGGGSSHGGPGSAVGTFGPGGGGDRFGSGDRHGGSGGFGGSSGTGSGGEVTEHHGGTGGGGGLDDHSGPGGGGGGGTDDLSGAGTVTDQHSGPGGGGGTDDHSGPGGGSTISEPVAAPVTDGDHSGSGSSGSGSSGTGSGSGFSITGSSGSSSSGSGRSGGGDDSAPPTTP